MPPENPSHLPNSSPDDPLSGADRDATNKCKKHWLDYGAFGVEVLGLIGLAIYCFVTYGIFQQNRNTVTEMQHQTRIDERPWIKFTAPDSWESTKGTPIPIKSSYPLQVPVEFTNYGKTAARQNNVSLTEEIIPIGQEPDMPDDGWTMTDDATSPPPGKHIMAVYPSQILRVGTISPGEVVSLSISRVKITGREFAIDPVTEDELKKLNNGQAYIAIWGLVWYSDIFGTSHSTKFCRAIPKAATLQKCANYNDVDNNDGTEHTK